MEKPKGFIHAVEGIMASLLLLVYLASIPPPVGQKADWGASIMKQTGSEYLASMNQANLSRLIIGNNAGALGELNRYFFAGSRISLASESMPKERINVGVLSNYSGNPVIYFYAAPTSKAACDAAGWATEYGCIINSSNPLGKTAILADTDSGNFNNRTDYDAVYFDINGNAAYDSGEGPFLQNSIATIGQDYYSLGYVDNTSKSSALLNASWAIKLNSNIAPVNINGRNITMLFFSADPAAGISRFDALVIAGPLNISAYETALRNFLAQGKGIAEISNMSNATFNSAQSSIFGIQAVNYTILGSNSNATLSRDIAFPEPAGVKDFFAGTAMRFAAPVTDTTGYDVSRLPAPASVRLGVFNSGGAPTAFALARNSASYDAIYFDTNSDRNFTNPSSDLTGYPAGSTFDISGNRYAVKEIDAAGAYAGIRPFANHTFRNINHPIELAVSGGSAAVMEEENTYSISTNAIGSSVPIGLYPAPVLGNPATLPQAGHTYGIINQSTSNISGAHYNIAATNATANYTLFNIDFNADGNYNGTGEGPFATGEIVAICPEQYRIKISPDGSIATLGLEKREKVPLSIAGYLYSGRTVWMPYITDSGKDTWNYIAAAVLWVSDKKVPDTIRAGQSVVSVSRVFVQSGDMYLPYDVRMSIGR